jgi:hypothetical protein
MITTTGSIHNRHILYKSKCYNFLVTTIRWVGHVACMGERRGAYRVLVGKPKGKKPLGRTRHRWEDNIKMDLQEVEWGAWAGLIWLRTGTCGGHL